MATAHSVNGRILEVYILDATSHRPTQVVAVRPEGCLPFSRRKYDAVRWHNATSWESLWIVNILADPDYDCATDSYTWQPARHPTTGVPQFQKFGPIHQFAGKVMPLPTYRGKGLPRKGLPYCYDIEGSGTDGSSRKRLIVLGWQQDPHFALQ